MWTNSQYGSIQFQTAMYQWIHMFAFANSPDDGRMATIYFFGFTLPSLSIYTWRAMATSWADQKWNRIELCSMASLSTICCKLNLEILLIWKMGTIGCQDDNLIMSWIQRKYQIDNEWHRDWKIDVWLPLALCQGASKQSCPALTDRLEYHSSCWANALWNLSSWKRCETWQMLEYFIGIKIHDGILQSHTALQIGFVYWKVLQWLE